VSKNTTQYQIKDFVKKRKTICSETIDSTEELCYTITNSKHIVSYTGGFIMAKKTPARYTMIYDYVNQYYAENSRYPSVRDIVAGTGIPVSTVHRYLNDMKESGEIEYNGRRSISTSQTEMESPSRYMKVLGYVACGEGQEEEETVIEYIRMPESIVGKGNFFALIAKGESMIDAGIHPGDYVIVRQQKGANDGDFVVALYEGKNNLKQLIKEDGRYILRSCNEDKETYPDIYPEDLQIQGVAVCVTHKLI
jgi:repressor LexA